MFYIEFFFNISRRYSIIYTYISFIGFFFFHLATNIFDNYHLYLGYHLWDMFLFLRIWSVYIAPQLIMNFSYKKILIEFKTIPLVFEVLSCIYHYNSWRHSHIRSGPFGNGENLSVTLHSLISLIFFSKVEMSFLVSSSAGWAAPYIFSPPFFFHISSLLSGEGRFLMEVQQSSLACPTCW